MEKLSGSTDHGETDSGVGECAVEVFAFVEGEGGAGGFAVEEELETEHGTAEDQAGFDEALGVGWLLDKAGTRLVPTVGLLEEGLAFRGGLLEADLLEGSGTGGGSEVAEGYGGGFGGERLSEEGRGAGMADGFENE